MISVIIPTYNRASMLVRAVRSVLMQEGVDLELIVVDDGSTDNTESTLAAICDSRVRYHRLAVTSGVSAARNAGLRLARGELIAFLDSDDEFLPGKLAKQARLFSELSPQPGLIFTNYWEQSRERRLIFPMEIPSGYVTVGQKFPASLFNGPPSWMLSRACLEKVGLFDEVLRTLEDLDFFARAARQVPVYYYNEALQVIHVHNLPEGRVPSLFVEPTRQRILEKWLPQMSVDKKFLSDFYYVAGKDFLRVGQPRKALAWLNQAWSVDRFNTRVLRKLFQAWVDGWDLRWLRKTPAVTAPRSILIMNPYGIGDVIFSTPLIRNLHRIFPAAKIHYLCNKRTEPILRDNPLIDQMFIYERDAFLALKTKSVFAWAGNYLSFIKSIRRRKIDLAVDLSLNVFFGMVALAAGIPRRVGLDYKRRGLFLNKKLSIYGFDDKHVAEYYLDLLHILGQVPEKTQLEIYTNAQTRLWARECCRGFASGREAVIGVAPFGGETWGEKFYRKRWPAAKFAELIDALIQEKNAKVFLFGGSKDAAETEKIIANLRHPESCKILLNESLERVIALVDRCDLFISNDTGLLRFADAFGKKIIAFFGPVDERVYGMFPFVPQRHIYMTKPLPCRPCYFRFRLKDCERDNACLRDISTQEVMREVERLLRT
ncbi:MAG: glycosyltransferase [Candidatus Omnitrophica bacterium]|nr:glycosyltransferase [Candidatus Omnitrophota bacterium]